MLDQQDQAKPLESESLTLWLRATVIEDLNELVGLMTSRKEVATKSSVVSELIRRGLAEARRKQR